MKTDTANFLETLLFVSDEPFQSMTVHDFHPDFTAAVDSFIAGFRDYLAAHHPDLDPDAGQRSFGGNCYFSLSGHGCGFWDDSNSEYGDAMQAALVNYSASLPGGERSGDQYRFEELDTNLSKRRGGKIDLAYRAKCLPTYRRRIFGMPEPVEGFEEITFSNGEVECMAHREGKSWIHFYAYARDVSSLPASWQWTESKNPLFRHLVNPSPGKAVNALRARGFVSCP